MKKNEITLLKVEIESVFSDLNAIVSEIREALKEINSSNPTHREKAALGSFLHSFYNGIENILKRLAEEINNSVPIGEHWHRALLRRMEREVENVRPWVLKGETVDALEPYLGFEHFFRHSYTFDIDWQKLEALAKNIDMVFNGFRSDIDSYFDKFMMES